MQKSPKKGLLVVLLASFWNTSANHSSLVLSRSVVHCFQSTKVVFNGAFHMGFVAVNRLESTLIFQLPKFHFTPWILRNDLVLPNHPIIFWVSWWYFQWTSSNAEIVLDTTWASLSLTNLKWTKPWFFDPRSLSPWLVPLKFGAFPQKFRIKNWCSTLRSTIPWQLLEIHFFE